MSTDEKNESTEKPEEESSEASAESEATAAEADAEGDSTSEADSEDASAESAGDSKGVAAAVQAENAAATSAGGGRLVGYLGGLAIIGFSLWSISTGERNMFEVRVEAEAEEPKGPCEQWEAKVCEGVGGEKAHACTQVKAAAGLLSDRSCEQQLRELPATIEKVLASRSDCETLKTKLCGDLGEETQGCTLVKERTPSFPGDRCTEMLGKYDQVLSELQRINARGVGGPPGAHGGPPGAHGHPGGGAGRPPMPRLPKGVQLKGPGGAPIGAVPGKAPVAATPAKATVPKGEKPAAVPAKAASPAAKAAIPKAPAE